MSPPRRLRIPHEVTALVRGLHPVLKRKVRAGLEALLQDPYAGKALRNELQGLRSYRVGRFRIIHRLREDVELVAFGPRDSIYLETYRRLHEPRARYRHRQVRGSPLQSAALSYASGIGQARSRSPWTFVQADVRDVGPDTRRPVQPDHRVEVRPVHVHLPAVLVDDAADVHHVCLERAVGGCLRVQSSDAT